MTQSTIRCAVLFVSFAAGAFAASQAQTKSVSASAETPAPAITYQKVFKGSTPEYMSITVRKDGTGDFDIRQLNEKPQPVPFKVSAPLVAEIFQLAGQLHDFEGVQLDARRRIAYLGKKTFLYEQNGEKQTVTYNYTLNTDASQLQRIFEGLGREQNDLQDLQRSMRYDKLGVNDVLQRIQTDLQEKSLPEPESLLPTLDQIAADDQFMDIARDLARELSSNIRNPK